MFPWMMSPKEGFNGEEQETKRKRKAVLRSIIRLPVGVLQGSEEEGQHQPRCAGVGRAHHCHES